MENATVVIKGVKIVDLRRGIYPVSLARCYLLQEANELAYRILRFLARTGDDDGSSRESGGDSGSLFLSGKALAAITEELEPSVTVFEMNWILY